MKCPAELYTPSPKPYRGIGEPQYPFHDKTVVVTNCDRLCLYRKKINLSTCLAGRAVGIKQYGHFITGQNSAASRQTAQTHSSLASQTIHHYRSCFIQSHALRDNHPDLILVFTSMMRYVWPDIHERFCNLACHVAGSRPV
jgi:hypothetical protein